jgi:RNA polymerase sigma factor, sigma-70 family
MKYDVEMYTGIKIEDLFYKYRDLAAKTVNKYYSRYIRTAWQEDVYNVAEMGLYESLQNIKLEKIKNELSIKSAIIWGVRGSIKDWERELFGYEGTFTREGYYKTNSYNNKCSEDGKEFEETLSSDNLFTNNEISEEQRIEYMDLYKAIKKLNKEEQYFIKRTAEGITLVDIGKEMGIDKDKVWRMKQKTFSRLRKELEAVEPMKPGEYRLNDDNQYSFF